jgi:hypothetical protein
MSMSYTFCFQGTARRKKKVVHKTAATDDKKLQSNLKKLSVTNIPGIEEVASHSHLFACDSDYLAGMQHFYRTAMSDSEKLLNYLSL